MSALEWDIKRDGGTRRRDPVDRLKTDLDELEVFVREVLQNSLDAQLDEQEPVRVRFRLERLEGERKRDFLEQLDARTYLREMQETRATVEHLVEQNKSGRVPSLQITDKTIEMFDPDADAVLPLLYVDDERTTGLTGVELDYGQASRFCACCRDAEFSVKQDKRSGGSYGKGKNTLWRHARTRLVLFYSELSEAFEGETSRFIGVGNLPWHASEVDRGTRKSGRCYLGRLEGGEGKSALGGHAREIAKHLGMYWPARQSGTTICIVGFDPRFEEDLSDDEIASRLRHVTETWYWPAIIDSRMEVEISNLQSGALYQADPHRREDLEPYIDCWLASVGLSGKDKALTKIEIRNLTVPPGPQDEPEATCEYSVAIQVLLENIPPVASPKERIPGSERVALVRGFGMVVDYKEHSVHKLMAEPYVGVCRAGLAYPDRGGNRNGQERLEQLLSTAEPEAHDCWRASEIDARSWWGAKARINELLREIQGIVDGAAVADRDEKQGSTVPELSRRFRFKGDKGPTRRTSRVSLQKRGQPQRSNGKVIFPISIKGLTEPLPGEGQLEIRLSAGLVDSAAGPGARQETIPVEEVLLGGESLESERPDKAGKQLRAMVGLNQHQEPLDLEVVAALAPGFDFEDAHYMLDARVRILGSGGKE
jgi:hypothetical protein